TGRTLAMEGAEVYHTGRTLAMEGAEVYHTGRTPTIEGVKGWYLITVDGYSLGWGKLSGGVMKNHYPKGLRK
ncbi:MAG: RNA methyltransferase, partial [Clostridium sp.]|nr:RNA methyltransferase [Clostridium sp.]